MLIKNGNIATAFDTFKADILIENGIIKEIGKNIDYAGEVIDATEKYVLPGAIDVHTHFDLDVGIAKATDDFFTGTVAAACGGTTTIIDHIGFGPSGCHLHHQIDKYHSLAKGKAVIDYSFHGVIQHINDDILDELEKIKNEGITSIKFYMTYDYMLSDYDIYKLLEKTKELGMMITFHPENDGVIKYLKEKFRKENKLTPIYHAKSRPEECEAEAINRVLMISSIIGDVPIYVVHLSNSLALEVVKNARENGLNNVFVETCPQYLFLNEDLYNQKDGLKYIMSPPLRNKKNNDLLWEGIINDDIQVIGTDHCPFNYNIEKQMGIKDFTKCPNGAPGVETRPMLIFSKGVMENKISINKFVDICSTKPAKLFGMYPKKGTIEVGSDADIIIIDTNSESKITVDNLHENVDYSPYENIKIKGKLLYTISRGEIIVKDNEFLQEKGRGQFVKREIPLL
ncbi:dihydropyrimidinase [Mycoplasmatota bacterium zrk1]